MSVIFHVLGAFASWWFPTQLRNIEKKIVELDDFPQVGGEKWRKKNIETTSHFGIHTNQPGVGPSSHESQVGYCTVLWVFAKS